ncbi:hypothetical protein AB0M46_12375 [Dactylosporangium sp. NPDC051485]|uniref:hypothetical protein n=1 Tax=Dactylosporangium sp. NPDC051485 TaxID=3154846 RepID=UPI003414FD54
MKAHPGMYFGAYPAADWPLVIAAWTAADLLRLAGDGARVELVLHRGGALSASVRGASVTAPLGEEKPIEDVIRSGMWYTELSRATAVAAGPQRPGELVGGEQVWRDLDVTVHSDLDGALFGVPDGQWWRDGVSRLAAVLATPRHRPADGQRVHVTDEATGERAELP